MSSYQGFVSEMFQATPRSSQHALCLPVHGHLDFVSSVVTSQPGDDASPLSQAHSHLGFVSRVFESPEKPAAPRPSGAPVLPGLVDGCLRILFSLGIGRTPLPQRAC